MNHYFLLIIGICMLFLIVNLFILILHINVHLKSDKKIYYMNLVTIMAISNYIEWNNVHIMNSNRFIKEGMVSLIYLINLLMCLILLLILLFVKDRNVSGRNN